MRLFIIKKPILNSFIKKTRLHFVTQLLLKVYGIRKKQVEECLEKNFCIRIIYNTSHTLEWYVRKNVKKILNLSDDDFYLPTTTYELIIMTFYLS